MSQWYEVNINCQKLKVKQAHSENIDVSITICNKFGRSLSQITTLLKKESSNVELNEFPTFVQHIATQSEEYTVVCCLGLEQKYTFRINICKDSTEKQKICYDGGELSVICSVKEVERRNEMKMSTLSNSTIHKRRTRSKSVGPHDTQQQSPKNKKTKNAVDNAEWEENMSKNSSACSPMPSYNQYEAKHYKKIQQKINNNQQHILQQPIETEWISRKIKFVILLLIVGIIYVLFQNQADRQQLNKQKKRKIKLK